MKTVLIQENTSANYSVASGCATSPVTNSIASMSSDINIPSFTSNGFELVSSQLTNASHIWQDNNNNALIYDNVSGKLWKLWNNTLTLVNNNFTYTLNYVHDNISDQSTILKFKYSPYNNVFYTAINPDADSGYYIRLVTLSGSDYSTVNLSSGYYSGHSSRCSCSRQHYTYDGPYFACSFEYVNNSNGPEMWVAKTSDNGATWQDTHIQIGPQSDFSGYVSVSSYNGIYYIFDPLGRYFGLTDGALVKTTDPTNLSGTLYHNSVICQPSYASTMSMRIEKYNSSTSIVYCDSLNIAATMDSSGNLSNFAEVTDTFLSTTSSNSQLYMPVSSFNTTSPFVNRSPLAVYSINTSSLNTTTLIKNCYKESGSCNFYHLKGDGYLTKQSIFYTDNYAYIITVNGLMRCHVNNLVTIS